VVAASRLSGDEQQYALDLADNWNERLEQFTYVAGSEVDQYFGTDGHYVRIGPAAETIKLANQPSGSPDVPAEALVGMEFLYLPRLGLRAASDPRITDTLKIVEAMIGVDTPSGRTYHRYDLDGYGEWLDGSGWPVRNFGIGRPWPLLAGERGHYDVLAGGNAATQLAAMVNMRGRGGLLPEQIWDANPIPWHDLQPGKPTGSAMPLAWAHSELIKLAVTATTGRPVEMLQRVVDRYHTTVPASDRWFWRDAAPVFELPPGRTLVVEETQPFTLHFGFDEWNSVTEVASQPLGLGMHGAVLDAGRLSGRRTLQFVRRYADGHWESRSRNDVSLNVPMVAALRLSPAERGRIASVRG
jgi:glucoamylase